MTYPLKPTRVELCAQSTRKSPTYYKLSTRGWTTELEKAAFKKAKFKKAPSLKKLNLKKVKC